MSYMTFHKIQEGLTFVVYGSSKSSLQLLLENNLFVQRPWNKMEISLTGHPSWCFWNLILPFQDIEQAFCLNYFKLNIGVQNSRTVKSLNIYPSWKLPTSSVIVLWMLAEDTRLLGQRKRTLLIMAQGSQYELCVCDGFWCSHILQGDTSRFR